MGLLDWFRGIKKDDISVTESRHSKLKEIVRNSKIVFAESAKLRKNLNYFTAEYVAIRKGKNINRASALYLAQTLDRKIKGVISYLIELEESLKELERWGKMGNPKKQNRWGRF